MMRIVSIILLGAMLSAPLHAQIIREPQRRFTDQWTLGLSLLGGIPLGEFRQHENGGGGGELSIGFQPFRRQPLVLRFSGGGMQYGAARARGFQEVCDDPNDPFNCYIDEVEYNARSHNMWYTQLGPEIMATEGTWRPFAFALAGYTGFASRANLKPTTPGGTETSEGLYSSTNFSTSYGIGIRRAWNSDGRTMGIELSPRVTRNANASYLTEQGVTRQPDGTWVITPREGAANLLGIYVGFWVGPRVLWNER